MLNLPLKKNNYTFLIETNNYKSTKNNIFEYAVSIGYNKENLFSGNSVDFKVIEEDNIIKVDLIRQEIVDDIYLSPRFEDTKIYLIYDASKMNISSQNTLLKTLEETPKDVIIFLVSTNIKNILDTIKSRCLIFYDIDNNINVSKYEDLKYFNEFINSICDINYESTNDFIDLLENISKDRENSNNIFNLYIDLLNIFLHDIIIYKITLNKNLMFLKTKIDILITVANKYDNIFWWNFIKDLNQIKLLQNNNLDYKLLLLKLYLKQKRNLREILNEF